MDLSSVLYPTLLAVAAWIALGFVLSRLLKRNDLADGLWGLGFIGVAGVHVLDVLGSRLDPSLASLSFHSRVVVTLVTLWGLRLSSYLWSRLLTQTEDSRYVAWRKEWGRAEPGRAFVQVFLLQGILLGLISSPIAIVIQAPAAPVGAAAFAGLLVFTLGFVLETTADAQLRLFKRDPGNRGRLMTQGLWGLCRHPNYLGEILVWLGIFLIVSEVEGGLMGLISPALITFLLVRVSGVPMLEKHLAQRGADFQKYSSTVPALLPVTAPGALRFVVIGLMLAGLDAVWLGGIMSRFYLEQAAPIARLKDGGWDVVGWAAGLVYVFIALGIQLFALHPSRDRIEAGFRGALFGLVTYGIYETTNLALVRDWPVEMALVDIGWGAALCGLTALATAPARRSSIDTSPPSSLA